MNPSTCFSVSLICAALTCAGEPVGKPTKTTATAATIMWYMAEPPALRIGTPHPGTKANIEHNHSD
jgi:hypothetical protein